MNARMNNMKRQRGAALMMGLLLLLVLTLLAVGAVNMSTINLRIVGNMQASQQADAVVNQAIEAALLQSSNFTTNKAESVNVAVGTANVVIAPRQCVYSEFIEDTSAGVTQGEIATWQVSATYTDPVTSAQTTIVRGVKMVMEGNGNCIN